MRVRTPPEEACNPQHRPTHQCFVEWGGGVLEVQKFVYQKQPNQYFLLLNFICSHDEIRVWGGGGGGC